MKANRLNAYSIIERRSKILGEVSTRLGSAYVYDLDAIRGSTLTLKNLFRPIKIYYSIKANPLAEIVKMLNSQLDGVEIASGGELAYALSIGVSPQRIIFAGPAKSETEIRTAADIFIHAIHAESGEQLRLCQAFRRPGTRVALRVNTPHGVGAPYDNMVGGSSRFGIDQEIIMDMAWSGKLAGVDGLHIYSGSQVRSSDAIIGQVTVAARLFTDIQQALGHPLSYLNIGGGFGVRHQAADAELRLEPIAEALHGMCGRFADGDVEVALELGRYLTAEHGVLVTFVREVKVSRGVTFALVDCGYNGFLRPSLTQENHDIIPLDPRPAEAAAAVVVGGPLCTASDTYGVVRGWQPRVGEPVALLLAGAYGWSMSPHFFLGHSTPAEVIIKDDSIRVVRDRVGPLTYMNLGRRSSSAES